MGSTETRNSRLQQNKSCLEGLLPHPSYSNLSIHLWKHHGSRHLNHHPIVIIHPGARWLGRCWTAEGHAQIADRLINEYNANVIITGSHDELQLVEHIVNLMMYKPIVAAGKTSLGQLLALLEKSDFFIGVDSGSMHMAVAMGINVIALFGAARPEAVGPYGDEHIVVTKQHLFPCSPCSQTVCKRKEQNCMQAITVEEVWKAVEVQMEKLTLETSKQL